MKTISLILFSFLSIILVQAQAPQNDDSQPKGFHQHDGFYGSIGIGIAPGNVYLNNPSENLTYAGSGFEADIKLGGAIAPNFILHSTITVKGLNDKKPIGVTGIPLTVSRERDFTETMIGAGFTYYVMPYNAYLSLSLGLGSFEVNEKAFSSKTSSPRGPAFQLKLGKEWWVAKNWGIGLGVTYEKTSLQNPSTAGDVISSEHIGVLFNATFN